LAMAAPAVLWLWWSLVSMVAKEVTWAVAMTRVTVVTTQRAAGYDFLLRVFGMHYLKLW
jgi:hypothetical protein